MSLRLFPKIALNCSSKIKLGSRVEKLTGLSIRHSAARHVERCYSTALLLSQCSPCRRESSVHVLRENRILPLNAQRWKSKHAQGEHIDASEKQQYGDDPPLYDKKPGLWRQWVFVVLALDVLFTGLSVEMVIQNWSYLTPTAKSPESSKDTSSSSTPVRKYELRPLWQRLGLASFEIFIGVAAGALILASRDRTVWRIRVRPVLMSSLPPGRPGMKPPPAPSKTSQTINVLTLETASGRKKRFLMRDCSLLPGRDLSELFLSISGVRPRFILSMNDARVLGSSADEIHKSDILKDLRRSKKGTEEDIALINTIPGGSGRQDIHISDLRKALAHAWTELGGSLKVPKLGGPRMDAWTSGPVTQDR